MQALGPAMELVGPEPGSTQESQLVQSSLDSHGAMCLHQPWSGGCDRF